MQTKKDIELACKELLYYIYKGQEYSECEYLKYKIWAVVNGRIGRVYLDGKVIAEIVDNISAVRLKIISLNFNDRYDTTIRTIFTALDIELIKFGKIWIGYLTNEGIPIPSDIRSGAFKPEKVKRELEEKLKELNKARGITPGLEQGSPGYYTIGNVNVFATTATNSFVGASYYVNGTNYSFSIPPTPEEDYRSISASLTDDRSVPANPALAQAQRRGVSHRNMEEMIRRGRMR